MNTRQHGHGRNSMIWGLIFIGVGVLILLDNLDYFYIDSLWSYWPFILVIIGGNQMIDFHSPKEFAGGAWLVMIGLWLFACIEHIWGLSFHNSWPIFLIACGISKILQSMLGHANSSNREHHHGE